MLQTMWGWGTTSYKGDLEAKSCPFHPGRPPYFTGVWGGAVTHPHSKAGKSGFEETEVQLFLMRCLICSSEGFAFPFILNT